MPEKLPTFATGPEALAALLWLWRSGVSAWVDRIDERAPLMPGLFAIRLPNPSFRICTAKPDHTRALELLAEFRDQNLDEDAEIPGDDAPVLSKLNPSLAPPCPNCLSILPLDDAISSCPHCATSVDVPDLIVQTHGPEAIADAYEQLPILDAASALFAPTPCRKCGYVLNGLPRVGRCPECGSSFDKDESIRAWFA